MLQEYTCLTTARWPAWTYLHHRYLKSGLWEFGGLGELLLHFLQAGYATEPCEDIVRYGRVQRRDTYIQTT